jgi:hypothetical protein
VDQFTSLALAVDQAADVISLPVVQAGEFVSSKHKFGKRVGIDRARLERIAANANSNVSGLGVMLDLTNDHSRGDSAGWMVPGSAKVAPFVSPKTKKEELGVWMDFQLNDKGKDVIGNRTRRFVSIDTQPYTDEQTQITTADVPFAVALTNKPIIKSLPPVDAALGRIAASEDADADDALLLAEIVESALEGIALADDNPTASVGGEQHPASDFAYVPNAHKPSTWKLPIFDKAHVDNAVARLNQSDIPEADLPAVVKAIAAARKKFYPDDAEVPEALKLAEDPEAAEAVPDDEGKTPAEQALEALDDAWQSLEALCKGGKGAPAMRQLHKEARQKAATILTPKGGITQMAETDKDTELQLAELKATNERISAELKASRLDRIKDRVERLPYDKATQEGLLLLAEASDGDTLALAEGDGVKNVPMIDYALALFENAQRVHTEVTTIEGPGAEGEDLSLAETKKTLKAMYAGDAEKYKAAVARLEAGEED